MWLWLPGYFYFLIRQAIKIFPPLFPSIQQYNFELNINAQNLGGVQLDDSLETVKEILGNAEEIKSYNGLNFVNYFYKNLIVTIENNVATLKGIRQGDSLKKVLATYGSHYQTRTFDNMEVYIYLYDLTSGINDSFLAKLRFAVENNFVKAITLMTVE